MKITYIYISTLTPPQWGSHRSYEMAKRLVKIGHDVHVVTSYLKEDKKKSFDTEIDGIKVHWIPVPYSNHMTFKRRIWAFYKIFIICNPSSN